MNNQILSVQNNNIVQIGPQRNVFREGASVFVKILGDNKNGTYTGSVAGNRVTISSSKELNVGSSFIATISAKNGSIMITPKENRAAVINPSSIEISIVQGSKLGHVLSSLGMPVTLLSENLLKMMMQLEMKVDGNVLREIYKMALKHKGKEKAAGEILLLLKAKGINVSPDDIDNIINFLNEDSGFSNSGEQFNSYKNNSKQDRAKLLINKINSKEGGWFFVPFNIIELNNSNVLGAGVIRFLVNSSNILKMINFNCYFDNKEFLFSLLFEDKKCNSIKFNINPCEKGNAYYEKLIRELFINDDIAISWCDGALIEGCGSEGEVIHSFYGEA